MALTGTTGGENTVVLNFEQLEEIISLLEDGIMVIGDVEEIKYFVGYKIFEKVEGGYKNLFHGRKTTFKIGDEAIADKKMVYEAYDKKTKEKRMYMSGIHIVETEELCRKYLRRFKDKSNKIIVECFAYDLNKKPRGNEGVYLANKILLIKELNNE